uniref:Uncharacterized protein n=1 Tax=Rhizophora mucronata TaxID=61149 RepID=A0A2P2PMA6_RHIMU
MYCYAANIFMMLSFDYSSYCSS